MGEREGGGRELREAQGSGGSKRVGRERGREGGWERERESGGRGWRKGWDICLHLKYLLEQSWFDILLHCRAYGISLQSTPISLITFSTKDTPPYPVSVQCGCLLFSAIVTHNHWWTCSPHRVGREVVLHVWWVCRQPEEKKPSLASAKHTANTLPSKYYPPNVHTHRYTCAFIHYSAAQWAYFFNCASTTLHAQYN